MIQLFSQIANLLGKEAIQDLMVDNTSGLTALSTPNYLHKLVWVKSEKTFFYLISGTGNQSSNWEKFAPAADNFVAPPYDSTKTYGLGSLVNFQGKLYMGLQSPIPVNTYPNSSNKWALIGPTTASNSNINAKMFDIPKTFEIGDNDARITRLPNDDDHSVYQLSHLLNTTKVLVSTYVLRSNSKDWAFLRHSVVDKDNIKVFIRDTDKPTSNLRIYVIPISSNDAETPIVWAGNNQTALDTTSITLSGILLTIDNPSITYLWTQISGPAVVISTPTVLTTNITGLPLGVDCTFKLTATDSVNNSFSSTVIVRAIESDKFDILLANPEGLATINLTLSDDTNTYNEVLSDTELTGSFSQVSLSEYNLAITSTDGIVKEIFLYAGADDSSTLLSTYEFTNNISIPVTSSIVGSIYIKRKVWALTIRNYTDANITSVVSDVDNFTDGIAKNNVGEYMMENATDFNINFDALISFKIYGFGSDGLPFYYGTITNANTHSISGITPTSPFYVEIYRPFWYDIVNDYPSGSPALTVKTIGVRGQINITTVNPGETISNVYNYGTSILIQATIGSGITAGKFEGVNNSAIIFTKDINPGQTIVPNTTIINDSTYIGKWTITLSPNP